MAERGDLARQAETRRVDETQQVERQGGVFLEQVFDLGRARLFAHQVDELDDGGLRGANGGGFDQRGTGKPVALEQLDAQVPHLFVLLGGLDLFGYQRGLAVRGGKLHQRPCQLGLERLHVQLDKCGQSQPTGIGAAQGLVVEGKAKAPRAQRLQRGHAAFNVFLGGIFGQRWHLQNHLFGVDQLQVAAREAVVRAVDEHRFLADQGFGAGVGQCVEQQRRIAGGGVRVRGGGPVKQFVAINRAVLIHDGLARNDGKVLVDGFGRRRCGVRSVLFGCARHGVH